MRWTAYSSDLTLQPLSLTQEMMHLNCQEWDPIDEFAHLGHDAVKHTEHGKALLFIQSLVYP